MRIKFEHRIDSEDELPELEYGRHTADVGKTWWDDTVWFIWTGSDWLKAIATRTAPAQPAEASA